jgi:hypothetical protein
MPDVDSCASIQPNVRVVNMVVANRTPLVAAAWIIAIFALAGVLAAVK